MKTKPLTIIFIILSILTAIGVFCFLNQEPLQQPSIHQIPETQDTQTNYEVTELQDANEFYSTKEQSETTSNNQNTTETSTPDTTLENDSLTDTPPNETINTQESIDNQSSANTTNPSDSTDEQIFLEPLTPSEQTLIDAGYGTVVLLPTGNYGVLMPNAEHTINGKNGGDLLTEYLTEKGLKASHIFGCWMNDQYYHWIAENISEIQILDDEAAWD